MGEYHVTKNEKVHGHKHFAVFEKIKGPKLKGNSRVCHPEITTFLHQHSVQQRVLDLKRF